LRRLKLFFRVQNSGTELFNFNFFKKREFKKKALFLDLNQAQNHELALRKEQNATNEDGVILKVQKVLSIPKEVRNFRTARLMTVKKIISFAFFFAR